MGMEGFSIADAMALAKNEEGEGMFGGNGAWVFFLFFLLAWGNGGLFGGNGSLGNRPATEADVQRGFDTSTIVSKLDGLTTGLADGFYAQNTTMLQGFNNINSGVTSLGYQMKDCCCEINRNIDALRFENSKNTCEIVNAIRTDGEATRALINANVMQDLRDKIADKDRDLVAANFQISQQLQNQYLISQLKTTTTGA